MWTLAAPLILVNRVHCPTYTSVTYFFVVILKKLLAQQARTRGTGGDKREEKLVL